MRNFDRTYLFQLDTRELLTRTRETHGLTELEIALADRCDVLASDLATVSDDLTSKEDALKHAADVLTDFMAWLDNDPEAPETSPGLADYIKALRAHLLP